MTAFARKGHEACVLSKAIQQWQEDTLSRQTSVHLESVSQQVSY